MNSISVKIHYKVKTKLEKLKEDLGFQTLSDTINCLLERYNSEFKKRPLKLTKKEWTYINTTIFLIEFQTFWHVYVDFFIISLKISQPLNWETYKDPPKFQQNMSLSLINREISQKVNKSVKKCHFILWNLTFLFLILTKNDVNY